MGGEIGYIVLLFGGAILFFKFIFWFIGLIDED